jgi:hypothetical protein
MRRCVGIEVACRGFDSIQVIKRMCAQEHLFRRGRRRSPFPIVVPAAQQRDRSANPLRPFRMAWLRVFRAAGIVKDNHGLC